MRLSNSSFYFETSAVNYLVGKYGWNDAMATKDLQTSKGNLWYLSPVTLWEILLTTDPDKREQIIFFIQHLFNDKVLCSPAEIIINFIKDGCPETQEKYDFHSKIEIATVWQTMCEDKRRTFNFNHEDLKQKMKLFQDFSKKIDTAVKSMLLNDKSKDKDQFHELADVYYQQIRNSLPYTDPDYHNVIKLSILFSHMVICMEMELDGKPLNTFWEKHNIKEPIERFSYLMTNHYDILLRGPIYQMALMAYYQTAIKNKSNRGLFMDCLHSIYFTFTDVFVTNDEHYSGLRDSNIHPAFKKIWHLSEIELVGEVREIKVPPVS